MSLEANLATWKLSKSLVTATEKLFLLSCARRAGEEHTCWPSIKRMVEDTGFDRKSIIKIRQRLINKKLLEYTGEMKGKSEQIPVMRLTYVHDDFFESDLKNNKAVDLRHSDQSTSTENGTGKKFTSPKSGTATSPKSGTLNIKEEKVSNIYVDFNKSTSLEGNHKQDKIFMIFYSAYPLQEKPKITQKAFYKVAKELKMDPQEFANMVAKDVKARVCNNWANRPKDKFPHPATYLNQAMWEGEIYSTTSRDRSGYKNSGNDTGSGHSTDYAI